MSAFELGPRQVVAFGAAEAAASRIGRADPPLPVAPDQLDQEARVQDPESPREYRGHGHISVCDVGLRYHSSGPAVLEHLDLELPPGEIVVLHGSSGCGRTSLANLLVRFRDPDEGAILLDGYNLRGYALADVHRAVGLAGHDAHLLSTTIRENGARVSGGQRQRIVLARPLVAGLRLLILDEPEALLGEETADSLIADVIAAAHDTGMGVLLITQRPIATDLIDRVIELQEGRICSDIYYDRAAPATTSL
jgi:ATP-binding cassette, subfamily C, bacterial CydC